MDKTWVSNKGNKRGTYDAFIESGTTYSEKFNGVDYEVSTGFDHIKELGVKAVQLLPVFDSDNEETYEKYKFNWGYNPLNYNCVEGVYSSDPTNGIIRIKEFKNMIYQLSQTDAHTRVIMDVVYNHVSRASGFCYTKLMPKYFFRYTRNGEYTNGSGCSNEVKTENYMVRKFIVDSVKFWATEYKIKGFRFDLMGLIDTETMRAVKASLPRIFQKSFGENSFVPKPRIIIAIV
jgi:pullulanase